ncbi:MAG TPA: MFS transporter [Steroidobacteraceae bacterium]
MSLASGAIERPPPSRSSSMLLAAAAILLITMGVRQSMGLFVDPIVASTGVGIAAISFALAIGQLVWGAAQPLFGAIADHYGSYRVLIVGGLLLAAGAALASRSTTELGLILSLGVLVAAGSAAGSFAILIGVTSQYLPAHRRSFAAGLINAGGSMGQFLFAPFAQFVISGAGWTIGMLALSVSGLVTVPIAWLFRDRSPAAPLATAPHAGAGAGGGAGGGAGSVGGTPADTVRSLSLRQQLRIALRDRSYLCLNAGFFTCGFHIAFLVTHWPGDLRMCGLAPTVAANSLALVGIFNVAGSVGIGWLGGRYRMKYLLALLYASRAAVVVCYLLMPKTALNVYIVAASLGVSWLATVPPTAGLVGKLFGTRYLTTLFGLTLLSHQIGGFLGAWLGGVAMAQLGSYQWVWYADIVLALLAAAVNLPIKEALPSRGVAQQAPA